VVPADNKWFTRLVVASAVIEALDSLELHYPVMGREQLRALSAARAVLEGKPASKPAGKPRRRK